MNLKYIYCSAFATYAGMQRNFSQNFINQSLGKVLPLVQLGINPCHYLPALFHSEGSDRILEH
jgi:hypothetical protein